MDNFSKPIYIALFVLFVFSVGMSSGLLWAKSGARLEGFSDISRSIKASVIPLGDDKSAGISKGAESFTYKVGKNFIDVDISNPKNVMYIVDLGGNEVGKISLSDGFDLANAQFIFSTVDKIYFFESKGVIGHFVPRR